MYMRAFALALRAHEGQEYGDGQPYIHHCVAVVHQLQVIFHTDEESTKTCMDERCIAILHDIVEDTDVTLDDLRAHGFNERVVEGVSLLTKLDALTYSENIQRIIDSGNLSAMRVKFSDNKSNHDNCGPDRERQRRKYDNSMLRLARAIAKTQAQIYRHEKEKSLKIFAKSVDFSTNVA